MKFNERLIRLSRCYGSADHRILVFPGGQSVYADGAISHVAPEEGRSAAERLTPDEAVRLLRERGVIEDEPVAFKVGDRVEVVGPIDQKWGGYVPDLDKMVGRFGQIVTVNKKYGHIVDFGNDRWNFPASSLRHAKAEAAPAQPDKWEHLPTDGEWMRWDDGVWHYRPDGSGGCKYSNDGSPVAPHRCDRKHVATPAERLITRAEAIAIFEANAAPDHIPDAGKMVTDEAHYIQEACDWREANRVAEARIAVLEQQLTDATTSALNADECLNQSRASHASCEDELYDARRDIIALRGKTVASLEIALADARSSEGVTGAQLATADATIADLRRQLAKSEDIYDELMCLAKKKDATIADLRKQSTAGAERGLTVDQVFARTAAMCLAAEYAPGTIGARANDIVIDAYILVAALKSREAMYDAR